MKHQLLFALVAIFGLSAVTPPASVHAQGLGSTTRGFDNADDVNQSVYGNNFMGYSQRAYANMQTQTDPSASGGNQDNLGSQFGSSPRINQSQKVQQGSATLETSELDVTKPIPATYSNTSTATGQTLSGACVGVDTKPEVLNTLKDLDPNGLAFTDDVSISQQQGSSDFYDEGNLGGSGSVGSGANGPSPSKVAGADLTNRGMAFIENARTVQQSNANSEPQSNQASGRCNSGQCQASRGGAAGEDALLLLEAVFGTFQQPLINVANENAGAACSSLQPVKTYPNVAYMVQKMYHNCYLPMAFLFLLPGALITNTKQMIHFGVLGGRDDDVVTPFTAIMRSIIAVFLIPATQLAMSYIIDVGNALEDCTNKYVSMPLIVLWAQEQIQVFGPDQQGGLIKNLPMVPGAPYLGKFVGMPAPGAVMEQLGGLQEALVELVNEAFHMFTIGLNVVSAFQIAMICYLFVMGPISAAFFAWPAVGRDLFRRSFATWLDGVVVLSLWKFWWTVVLVCMTARLESGFINPFDVWEIYYLIGFMCIMLTVPFNPFDFRPGEIVTHALQKAEGVANKVASGQGGGGKGGGKGAASKGGRGGGGGGDPSGGG